ncbi:MAG: TonB-dependent receptor, partial [Planctomycetota bacterium]
MGCWGLFLVLLTAGSYAQAGDPPIAAELVPTSASEADSNDESDDFEEEFDEEGFDAEFGDDDFGDLDLEDLMEIEVSLVSGSDQSLRDAPAAVFVITSEDIRRGGFTTIPDALRMVPGMGVAQVTASAWSVSARGFSNRFADKMLVLVDGRAVYNDLFAGVYWETVDYPLEDIERIEVVRGPGATIWGANAVNGVINIVTKKASDTHGVWLKAGGGSHEKNFLSGRYGAKVNEDFDFRVFAKTFNRNHYEFSSGNNAHDDFDGIHAGFRVDGSLAPDLRLTVTGEWHDVRQSEQDVLAVPTAPFLATVRNKNEYDGSHLLARVEKLRENGSVRWKLQAFWDRERLQFDYFRGQIYTYDVEFRHFSSWGDRHEIVWGLGYRRRADESTPTTQIAATPNNRDTDKYSAFVQDTITVVPEELFVMVGAKVEKNEYSGTEIQPSVRSTWKLSEATTAWGAVSRSTRTPSRISEDAVLTLGFLPPPASLPVRFVGDSSLDSEELIAYELGVRSLVSAALSVDVAAFYNRYDDLISYSGSGASPADTVITNRSEADTFGVELATTWRPHDRWTLHGTYSWIDVDVKGGDEGEEDNAPANRASLRCEFDVCETIELNVNAFYSDHRPGSNVGSYFRVDAGASWRPCDEFEFGVWGQNLTDS